MAFPISTRAVVLLGYSLVYNADNPSLFPSPVLDNPDAMMFVAGLVSQLEALDIEIAEAVSDSMATKVADINLDYKQYMAQALAKGNRLLQELSTFLGLPIAVNKYLGSGASGQVLAVKNYF